MATKGQVFKKVSQEIKLSAVNEKINGGKTYKFIAEKYGVSWKTVETWVRIFRRDGSLDVKKKGKPKQDKNTDYKEKYEILKKYLEFLEEVDQEKK
jgi:transposase